MKKVFTHPTAFLVSLLLFMILAACLPSGHLPSKVTFQNGTTAMADLYGKQLFLKDQTNPAGTFGKAVIQRTSEGNFIAVCTIQMGYWGYVDAPLNANPEQIAKWQYVFSKK